MSVNVQTLIGHVGQDPDVRDVNETKVAKFSLATTEKWKNRDGEKQEETTWHNVVIWGKLASVVESYVKKGDLLYISGRTKNRSYDDKDGVKKYISEVVCDQMQMLGGKRDSSPKEEEPFPLNKDNRFDDPFA